jgi:hypothetical protein
MFQFLKYSMLAAYNQDDGSNCEENHTSDNLSSELFYQIMRLPAIAVERTGSDGRHNMCSAYLQPDTLYSV